MTSRCKELFDERIAEFTKLALAVQTFAKDLNALRFKESVDAIT